MIRVRSRLPYGSLVGRRWRLARLRLDWLQRVASNGHEPLDTAQIAAFVTEHSGMIDGGYRDDDRVSEMRYAARLKCVWCEGRVPWSNPIDHFRPRRAHVIKVNHDACTVHAGYWWLTWNDDNLHVTCSTCNLAKGTKFPIEPGGVRCPPFDLPDDDTERPSLIDPTREDPVARIMFEKRAEPEDPEERSALDSPRGLRQPAPEVGRWLPKACHPEDKRAIETIASLKLKTKHLDLWEQHLGLVWRYEIKPLLEKDAAGEAILVAEAWRRLVIHVTDVDQVYRALTRAFIDHHFPLAWRDARGLVLPDLSDPGPPEPRPPLFADATLRARWGEHLALAVEACGSGELTDLARARDLFEAAGHSLDDLAEALGMSPASLLKRLK